MQSSKTPHAARARSDPRSVPQPWIAHGPGSALPFAAGSMTHIASPPSRPGDPSQLLLHLAFPVFPELHHHRTDNPSLDLNPEDSTEDTSECPNQRPPQRTRRQPPEALTTIGHTSGTPGGLSGMVPRPAGMPGGSIDSATDAAST